MNMQNKLHTIQFSHHLITDLQSVPGQQPWNPALMDFANFAKLMKKTKLLDKRGQVLISTLTIQEHFLTQNLTSREVWQFMVELLIAGSQKLL